MKSARILAAAALTTGLILGPTGAAVGSTSPGQRGYEGQPGHQAGHHGSTGQQGYEGQPGNQGGH